MMNFFRNTQPVACASFLVGAFILAGMQSAHSQTAEDILNKADAIYSVATTYQAIYHCERRDFDGRGKNDYSNSEMIEVKTNCKTKFALHEVFDKPKGHKQSASFWDTMDIVDDGNDQYRYISGENDYSRWIHDPYVFSAEYNTEKFYMVKPLLKPRKSFTYTLCAPTTINGKAAYVIKAKGSVEQIINMPPRWNKGHTMEVFFKPVKILEKSEERLYIDQVTYHLLQREVKYTQPNNSTQITQIIQNEILNVPLPDSAFVFMAPKGVTELGVRRLRKE